jgi:hypothetical protein
LCSIWARRISIWSGLPCSLSLSLLFYLFGVFVCVCGREERVDGLSWSGGHNTSHVAVSVASRCRLAVVCRASSCSCLTFVKKAAKKAQNKRTTVMIFIQWKYLFIRRKNK